MNSITIIDVKRSKCLKSLNFFTRYFFKETTGKRFNVSDHHEIIFDALERVVNGECKRLIINIAPRYSKTEIAVKNFIAYSLALNPKARFIHLSYSDTLALDNSETIKDLISSDAYQELFPYVQIKKDSKAKDKWYTSDGGGVLARSASGQVTGFGAGNTDFDESSNLFGGAIIIDDPIKPDDAESETQRDKVNYKFDSTIRNRVNSRNTPIIIIMQRLHENDLCGYLMKQEPGEWEVISMPVIKEDGSALWPDKHTIEELYKLRAANEFVFDTQYMQNPKPKHGLLFPKEELQRFRKSDVDLKTNRASIAFVDVADTGQDNHCAVFGKIIGTKIFIDDVVFTKEPTETNTVMTIQAANDNTPEFMQVESNFGGTMYIQLLTNNTEVKMNGVTALIPVNASQNKHTRIITASGFIKQNFVFLDESEYENGSEYDLFMRNLMQYTKTKGATKHDDAPDGCAGLAKMALSYYSHVWGITLEG